MHISIRSIGVGRPAANWGFGAFILMTVGTWQVFERISVRLMFSRYLDVARRLANGWNADIFFATHFYIYREYCHFKIRQKRQIMASGQMPVVSTIDLDAAKRREAIAARQRDV